MPVTSTISRRRLDAPRRSGAPSDARSGGGAEPSGSLIGDACVRRWRRALDASISCACARLVADSLSPPSMRAISATRASPATGVDGAARLAGRRSAWRRRSGGRRRRRPAAGASPPAPGGRGRAASSAGPTVSATAPPTPASTSSKISVDGASAPLPSSLVTTAIASAMRDSSPPEATLPSGRGVLPAWPATRNSADSRPNDCGASLAVERHLEAAAGHAELLHRLRHRGGELAAPPRGAPPRRAWLRLS